MRNNEPWYLVIGHLPVSLNLSSLSQYFTQIGLVHKINESPTGLQIWVRDVSDKAQVRELVKAVQEGEVGFIEQSVNLRGGISNEASQKLPKAEEKYNAADAATIDVLRSSQVTRLEETPVVVTLLLGSFLGWLLFYLEFRFPNLHWIYWFTYVDYRFDELTQNAQYWRLITPIFLHFSPEHFLFNSLGVWIIGRQIELRHGSIRLCGLALICALISNLAQYNSSPAVFGGMSGVLYGLLGYAWCYQQIFPARPLIIPFLAGFMLVSLLVGLLGLFDWLSGSKMANAAHIAGLVSGAFLGIVAAYWRRLLEKSTPSQ